MLLLMGQSLLSRKVRVALGKIKSLYLKQIENRCYKCVGEIQARVLYEGCIHIYLNFPELN